MWVISRVNILLYSTLSRFLLLEFLISSNWERATRTGVSYQPWNRGSLELRFFGKLFEAMFGFFEGKTVSPLREIAVSSGPQAARRGPVGYEIWGMLARGMRVAASVLSSSNSRHFISTTNVYLIFCSLHSWEGQMIYLT